jgi:hypothetical protein
LGYYSFRFGSWVHCLECVSDLAFCEFVSNLALGGYSTMLHVVDRHAELILWFLFLISNGFEAICNGAWLNGGLRKRLV